MQTRIVIFALFTLVLINYGRANEDETDDDIDLTKVCPVEDTEVEVEEGTCVAPGHPCDSNPCQNGGTCYEKFGALTYYRCYCTTEWIGRYCERVSTTLKPARPQYPGRYIPCHSNKFNKDGICFDDLYDF